MCGYFNSLPEPFVVPSNDMDEWHEWKGSENKRQTTLVIKKYIFVAIVTHLIQWKFTIEMEIKKQKLQHSAFSKK